MDTSEWENLPRLDDMRIVCEFCLKVLQEGSGRFTTTLYKECAECKESWPC